MEISDKSNLNRIAIVVIGYNRLNTTSKLLDSLNNAEYNTKDVPLIISIDKSGNEELYEYVRSFSWKHGDKYPIIREERLGLKRHIFECGNLSRFFKAVIILEDDVVVASDFYNYFVSAVDKYGDDERVSCISAYFNYLNGYVGLPFIPMINKDVFAVQEVSSTGECFTWRMWNEFSKWKVQNTPFDFMPLDIPDKIKGWKAAWTKYFNAYMKISDKYCIYPVFSTITNSGASGVHNSHSETCVQTVLMNGSRNWNLPSFEKLTKYDMFANNTVLYESLNISEKDLCLDMYGNNPNNQNKRYILSIKQLPYKVIKGFELSYRPHELNVIYDNQGKDLMLYDTSVRVKNKFGGYNRSVIDYYLYGFHVKYLPKYAIVTLYKLLIERLKKLLK